MTAHRVAAVFVRHVRAMQRSAPAWFDTLFWPVMDVVLWGLLTSFLRNMPTAVAAILGGLLLWDLTFRISNRVATCLLDDASWSRNLLSFLVSPLRPSEYIAGAVAFAVARAAVSWVVTCALAAVLFAFGIFRLGLPLVAFVGALLLFAVALGMVVWGLVLRLGSGADILAWGLAIALLPVSAVFYPVAVLPGWAQGVASVMPTAIVFESMRTVLAGRAVPWTDLWTAFALDAVYLAASFAFVAAMFRTFRVRGFVTRYM